MRNHKYGTPVQGSRARERRAQWERDDGIPDRQPVEDAREPFLLLLKAAGYHDLRIEPRRGYVAWRAVDIETDAALHCAALKELLHWIADRVPRYLALRNCASMQQGYTARDEADAAAA